MFAFMKTSAVDESDKLLENPPVDKLNESVTISDMTTNESRG